MPICPHFMPKGGHLSPYIDLRSQCDSLVIQCRLDLRDFDGKYQSWKEGGEAVGLTWGYCTVRLYSSSSDGNHVCQTLKTQTETRGRCVCGYKYGWGNCENGLSSRHEERKNFCPCHGNQNLRNVSLSQGQNGPWLSSISVPFSSHYYRGSPLGEAGMKYPISMGVREKDGGELEGWMALWLWLGTDPWFYYHVVGRWAGKGRPWIYLSDEDQRH